MPNTLIFTKLPSAKKHTTEHTRHNIQCCGVHPVRSKSVERMLRGHVQHTGAYPEYALRTCLKNTQRCSKLIGRKLRVKSAKLTENSQIILACSKHTQGLSQYTPFTLREYSSTI